MTEYIQKMFSTKSFFVIIFYCMLNWCLTAYINNDYELVMVHGVSCIFCLLISEYYLHNLYDLTDI